MSRHHDLDRYTALLKPAKHLDGLISGYATCYAQPNLHMATNLSFFGRGFFYYLLILNKPVLNLFERDASQLLCGGLQARLCASL
jgi:hypothetical protein